MRLSRVFQWLLPRNERFQELFREDAANLAQAGAVFLSLVSAGDHEARREKERELKDLEHRGDEITRRIFTALNTTFLTPIDREDIRDLASGIDNVLDDMEMVGSLMVQLNVAGCPIELLQMSEILASCTREIEKLVSWIWSPQTMVETDGGLVRISELENQADAIFSLVITKLFQTAVPSEAIEVMKWKEVYQALEDSVDRSKEVAHAIGNIASKNA
ncbi:MAG: DUF47 domain-containing protein [Vicinamibacteria bacterium]